MARAAIDRAVFYIGNGIHVELHPYSPELQMAFDPLNARARIRVYGSPLQHWNRADICQLLNGFGYPLRIAPYFSNGNYEYLTILVATKDAGEVPFNLDLKVNPHQKDIRIVMDGWITRDNPPPPHHGGRGGRGRGRHAGRGVRNQDRNVPDNCQNRGRGGNRANR